VFAVVGGYDFPRGKGQREFLRAAAQICAQADHARFLIIGRGSLKQTLEQDIQDLGLQGRAWLTPYCHDMPAAMNALDCLVHPQVGTEAFGAVLLEAFACGKPVIASALDGVTEAFEAGRQGRLVEPENVNALAAALLEQTRQPPLSLSDKRALHDRVAARFSLAALANNVLSYYQALVLKRP
jgi:glycosyltransferase involved in cell wall biosynthesis